MGAIMLICHNLFQFLSCGHNYITDFSGGANDTVDSRRRVAEVPSIEGQSLATTGTTHWSVWLVMLLIVCFLAYWTDWFGIRRFMRPARKVRDSLRDLEAGL